MYGERVCMFCSWLTVASDSVGKYCCASLVIIVQIVR